MLFPVPTPSLLQDAPSTALCTTASNGAHASGCCLPPAASTERVNAKAHAYRLTALAASRARYTASVRRPGASPFVACKPADAAAISCIKVRIVAITSGLGVFATVASAHDTENAAAAVS